MGQYHHRKLKVKPTQVNKLFNKEIKEKEVSEGFYNFSDICVPVDLFTPSLYKFDVTGKDIEDNHIMEHEHKKENYSIYR